MHSLVMQNCCGLNLLQISLGIVCIYAPSLSYISVILPVLSPDLTFPFPILSCSSSYTLSHPLLFETGGANLVKALDRAYVVQSLPSKSRSSPSLGLCAEDAGGLHLGDDVEAGGVVEGGEVVVVDEDIVADVDVDEVEVRRTILAVVIYCGWSRRSVWKFGV